MGEKKRKPVWPIGVLFTLSGLCYATAINPIQCVEDELCLLEWDKTTI